MIIITSSFVCFILLESYVKTHITDPAVKGTLNVLKSCLKSNTVRRVVFTSSVSTLTAKDNLGRWVPVVDESCQTPVDQVLKTKASGWVLFHLQTSVYTSLEFLLLAYLSNHIKSSSGVCTL